MALSLLPTAALAEGATGAGPIKVGGETYSSFSDAVNAAAPDENGVITYEISGKVDVTDTGWVQVAKAGLADLSKVAFVGINDDAEICITGGLAILADQKYDIDVSFTNLKLSKPNPTYGGDYGHSTNYFTCWLRNTGAAENTVTYTNCTFPNGVCNNQYGKTVFNNCKFTNNTAGLSNLWNYGGETKVEECTFTGTRGIKMYNEGTLQNPPSIEIKNTNFTGMTEKAAIVVSKAANVTLNTVGATDCTMGLLQKDIEGSTDEQKVTIEANGTGISGDFNITAQKDAEAAKNEFNITAGTFAGEINNDYLAPGANFDATTGEVKMSYVAKIGDTEYPTLADAFAAANKTGDTVIELLDDINMTGKSWTPVSVDGYYGQGVITLNGNGKTITGLSAPLFAGGFAGKSGIVIKDLTIAGADINDTTNTQGIGAFINCVDSMTRIELDNCHLKNSKIVSTGGARVGGLIGWTSGYNKPNDGPVDTKVTLTNCSVENVTIEAKGSVGGLIGHAGANPATYHTITGCTVKDSTLKCTETGKSWRVGDLVGTANVGQVTVDAATSASQNTLTQENADPQEPEDSIFGRKEVGKAGLVIIDNKVVAAGTAYGDIVNKNANEVLVEVSKGHWVKPDENTVAMIGAKEYTTLAAAINEANTGDTVKLVNNVTEAVTIPADKTITLDLNGKKLTNADGQDTITVALGASLTVTGSGTVDNVTHGKTAIYNNGTVILNGGSYTRSAEASTSIENANGNSYYNILNHGTMTIGKNVSVTSRGSFSSLIANGYYNFSDTNPRSGYVFGTNQETPSLTINGGTFSGGINTIKNDDNATLTVNNGSFSNMTQAAIQNNHVATINGGTFDAKANHAIENRHFDGGHNTGSVTVTSGTFTGGLYTTTGATWSISGGTFSSDPSVYVVGNGSANIVKRDGSEGAYTYTVLAKSGLTSGVYLTDPSGALASNYYVSSTANGVWTVSYSAPSSGGGSSSSSRRYDVSAPSVKHGDVTVSPKSASKGDTVTITVKPDSGYELDTLTVKDASGSKIKVKDKGDGKFTFTMPASKVTVSAEFAEIETLDFADVSTDAYYYEAVKWAAKKGITGGIGNGLFGPNQPCTRAQIVTFLWRAAGSPEPKTMSSFSDVSTDSYYAKAVAWAVENGITTGTGDDKFSPDATCTRAQSVTFLFRAIGKLVDSKAEFSDVLTDSYYANAVAWAVENGVTNGIGDGLFGPDNSCTRAQIVTFLYRAYQGK